MSISKNSRRYAPAPSISHGQSLVWSDRKSGTGLQGVTELTTCERTKDLRLKSVQDEFRVGKLSADAHAFLHGAPTLVPGHTIFGVSKCRNPWCRERAIAMTEKAKESLSPEQREELAKDTTRKECKSCKKEGETHSCSEDGL